MLRRLATTTTLIVAAAAMAAPASAAPQVSRAAPVRVTGSNGAFSPNGDGSKDLGVVRYQLGRRANVTVRVSSRSGTVLTRHVRRVAGGTHYFAWNGLQGRRAVADGTYTVSIAARRNRHATPVVARTALTVDARYSGLRAGETSLSSDTVYPRTTVIRDVVVGNFLPSSRFFATSNVDPSRGRRATAYSSLRMQVLDGRGRVIDGGPLVTRAAPLASPGTGDLGLPCPSGCGRFTWDGRRSSGAIAAPGLYRLRLVQGRDRAGNPRVVAPLDTVAVSAKKLVATTTTQTKIASLFLRLPSYSLNGEDVYEAKSPSSRRGTRLYDASPSSATCAPSTQQGRGCTVRDRFVIPFTGRRTPADTITVVETGIPATTGIPGSSGTLVVGNEGGAKSSRTDADRPTVVSEAPFADNTETSSSPSGLQWSFETANGNAVFADSFDVSWTTYVPAS